MKIKFESDLDFQRQAIDAVTGLFQGQETCRSEFTVEAPRVGGDANQVALAMEGANPLGYGNSLLLSPENVLENLHRIQQDNGLALSPTLSDLNFTVEMETGTGKTYVYLRTIFNLNQKYGFTKFIIVVPSVAIKEGVYKTLEMTAEHFRNLYSGVPYEYFLYDSSKLGKVRSFATSSHIQIMVMTVGAINKKEVNNLYKDSEKTGGDKPIDLISATRPIVIIDEPQSVDGGLTGQGKQAVEALNPLCTLRYSATHVHKYNMVYRLSPVRAYQEKLVKQIEVASGVVEDANNSPYVKFIKSKSQRGSVSAEIEVDVATAGGGVTRTAKTVLHGDDLEEVTNRAVYAGHKIGMIRHGAKAEQRLTIEFPGDQVYLAPGGTYGDISMEPVHREMIRRTIEEHLKKEKRLRSLGIKVLSLFFIDHVDSYRSYDESGSPQKGPFALMFEEEYMKLLRHPEYSELAAGTYALPAANEAHDGYFSIDKKGGWTDTSEGDESGRASAERAYRLIMSDKERLLSLETGLRFIFSHSALKEGWDNPNVFQICSLRDMNSEQQRRQTIGRGLRIAVNQDGDRVPGFDVNTLTVIANESYADFAQKLQEDFRADGIDDFGILAAHDFANITVISEDGTLVQIGQEASKAIFELMVDQGYVDNAGKTQDALRLALKDAKVVIPENFDNIKDQIIEVLRQTAGTINIKNADERREVAVRKTSDGKAVTLTPEFQELWARIKQKSTYRVHFDSDKLIEGCIKAVSELTIPKPKIQWRTVGIKIDKSGVSADETTLADAVDTVALDAFALDLPDILTELERLTNLTRKSLFKILTGSGKLNDFKRNPQGFIERAAAAINTAKRLAIVDGISYQRLGEHDVYAQELFESKALTGYLRNLLEAKKSVYESVVFDIGSEKKFAESLEAHQAVKLYAKLPGWFTIPTPLGTYNPDWAILIDADGTERLYFVVETKGSTILDDLRSGEAAKIKCAKLHFAAIKDVVPENPATYTVAVTLRDVLDKIGTN